MTDIYLCPHSSSWLVQIAPLMIALRILSMRKQRKQQLHELEKIHSQNDSTIKGVKRNHDFTTNAKLIGAIVKWI